jgi:1-deoxy-D-xylulose-5-phosphate reductoisomerase
MAHLGPHDMRHAIGYALNWPRRAPLPVERLDLARLALLTFEAPDPVRFPALRLARAVMQTRGLSGAAFNAAKEVALDHFLARGIGFCDMAAVVEDTLARLSHEMRPNNAVPTLEEVQGMDHLARRVANEIVAQRQKQG